MKFIAEEKAYSLKIENGNIVFVPAIGGLEFHFKLNEAYIFLVQFEKAIEELARTTK